jgi:hypothetical protein
MVSALRRAAERRGAAVTRFQDLVELTNAEAFKFTGSRSTCVLTAHALNFVCQRLELSSRVLRIESAVFPNEQKLCGTILGAQSRERREAASPGNWWGHLGVVIDEKWLLDATLDQANKREWPRDAHVGPMAVRLPAKFWAPWGSTLVPALSPTGLPAKSRVRFSPHRRQVGFKKRRRREGIALAGACRPDP